MKKLKKRTGAVYLLVIVVFVFVSMFSAMMLSSISQSIYQINTYGLQMQCSYFNQQAADATVAALLDSGNELLNSDVGYPRVDTMTHKALDGTTVLGESKITLKKENHDYYGESKAWAVAEIETTMPDPRAANKDGNVSYVASLMVLVENPIVQLYNINPESI